MSDQDKFWRMLDMLMLLSKTYGTSIDKLAAKYKISRRSVYRYIKTFKDVGFVVKKDGDRYRVETADTPYSDIADLLYFSREEAYMLSEAIHNLNDEEYKHQQFAFKLAALYDSSMIAAQLVPKREVRKVKDLITALAEKVQVVLKNYRYGGGDEGTDILVEPFAFTGDFKGIWAYDIQNGKNEFLRIGRIGAVELRATPWMHTESHEQGTVDIFGSVGFGNRRTVIMEMDRIAYGRIRKIHPRSRDYIKRIYSERYRFQGPVIHYEGVGRFVLSMPDHIKVTTPNAFKDYLKDKAGKIMRY